MATPYNESTERARQYAFIDRDTVIQGDRATSCSNQTSKQIAFDGLRAWIALHALVPAATVPHQQNGLSLVQPLEVAVCLGLLQGALRMAGGAQAWYVSLYLTILSCVCACVCVR